MTLLTDTSPLSKLPQKRLEYGGYRGFPPNFKRPKVDAVRHFPKHCGACAPRITSGEGGNTLPSDTKSESTKQMGSGINVEALGKEVKVDRGKNVCSKSVDGTKLTNLRENLTQAKPGVRSRKYPPWKIRKGVTVVRKFPAGFEMRNHTSVSKVLANKPSVDTTTEGKETTVASHDGSEGMLEKEALKEVANEVQAKYTQHLIGSEMGEHIEGNTSSENEVKQDKEIEVGDSFVGGTGKELAEFCEDKGSEEGNDKLILYDGASQPNTEKSIVLCRDSFFDDTERHKPILIAKESDGLSIVSFDDFQAGISRNKVKDVLNLFDEAYTKLFKEHKVQSKGKGMGGRQLHLEAAMLLKQQQKCVNTERLLGDVPGVEIGDRFRFRAELVVIGLHHQFQGGIDYMKKDGKILATSIVASGRYANDAGSSDVLIYSGQGGNPRVIDKKPEDQKLDRGNLALKNSMDAGTAIRVIRGRKNIEASTMEKMSTYVYDGLYIVTNYTQERGQYGKLVFMFQLNRLGSQPKVTGEIVCMPKKPEVCKALNVVADDDISQGKERMPIGAINIIDDEKLPQFSYITNVEYPEWYNPSILIGCDCIDGCSDLKKCPCTIKNGGEIPFNSDGAIVRRKPLVHECGPSCKCPPSCTNRVSQHGIQHQLEVFKTKSMGWGVRSTTNILSGSFICEYTGELLRDKEAEQRTGNDEYLFDIGKKNGKKVPQDEASDDDGFTIDAASRGNVGRFINHSCSPNLYAQNILYDHDDKRMPHIMLFATKGIPRLQELTYDYNYKLDQVRDGNGNIKKKDCYCGSRKCSGRMY